MNLAVLYPGGRAPSHSFPEGAGNPKETPFPPTGAAAFAAGTSGGYYPRDQDIPAGMKNVLVVIDDNLKACRQAFVELRAVGKTVAIAWHDPAPARVAELLVKPDKLKLFQEICLRADGAIATTPELVTFFNASGVRHTEFIPTPWPIDDARWDLSLPIEERRGILVGTCEFRAPLRNHLTALLALRQLAASMYETITLINIDGRRGRGLIERLGYDPQLLNVVELHRPPPTDHRKFPYPDYLRLIARHKIVWQLDATGGIGQVAGDALLARVPCVGGVGATERLVYPDLCAYGRDTEQLFDIAARLLEHPHDCEAVMERAISLAKDKLSFAAAARRLDAFFQRITRR